MQQRGRLDFLLITTTMWSRFRHLCHSAFAFALRLGFLIVDDRLEAKAASYMCCIR